MSLYWEFPTVSSDIESLRDSISAVLYCTSQFMLRIMSPSKKARIDRKRERERQLVSHSTKKGRFEMKRKRNDKSNDGPLNKVRKVEVEVDYTVGVTRVIRQGYIESIHPNYYTKDSLSSYYNGKCVYHISIPYWGGNEYPFIESEFRYI